MTKLTPEGQAAMRANDVPDGTSHVARWNAIARAAIEASDEVKRQRECKHEHAQPAATQDEREHCDGIVYRLGGAADILLHEHVVTMLIEQRAATRAECDATWKETLRIHLTYAQADLEFYRAAHAALPSLLDEIERLRAQVGE